MQLTRHLRQPGVEREATNGSAPHTIRSVTIASFENVVAYQSCWK